MGNDNFLRKKINTQVVRMASVLWCWIMMGLLTIHGHGHADEGGDARLASGSAYCVKESTKPPPIGNFALPSSQTPGALLTFGGNILEVGEVKIFFFADRFVGKHKLTIDGFPGLTFGVTDNFSVMFGFPFTPCLRNGKEHSSGWEDCFIQGEYAFYNSSTFAYSDQASLVATFLFPTGSSRKKPSTGFGAPSFFLGAVYHHSTVDWFMSIGVGGTLTGSDHGTKLGDKFLYECSIGRNIPSPEGWIYACVVEMDGEYSKKNRMHGVLDPDSGGNVIYLTPSLWVSSKRVVLQFGVSFPVNQNWFGSQRKFDYALNFNFSWAFYPESTRG